MARFTKALRQKIVEEFAIRHNGQFDAALFLKEVREQGVGHPAHDWFEWDESKAAQAYQLEQARSFASDLRVTFRVEEVVSPGSVRVREVPMPTVISPLENRNKGGGYRLVDPDDPQFIEEHCRQAARALSQWMNRYEAALTHAKINLKSVENFVGKLEHAGEKKSAA